MGKIAFKLLFPNYQISFFKFLKYTTDTELSNEVWQMKNSGHIPVITSEIVRKYSHYNHNSKTCYYV